jgi:hypothetical protein
MRARSKYRPPSCLRFVQVPSLWILREVFVTSELASPRSFLLDKLYTFSTYVWFYKLVYQGWSGSQAQLVHDVGLLSFNFNLMLTVWNLNVKSNSKVGANSKNKKELVTVTAWKNKVEFSEWVYCYKW